MMLAIVLSALVLLGWTMLAPKFFPTATPQTTVIKDGKSIPLPQPAASPFKMREPMSRSLVVMLESGER